MPRDAVQRIIQPDAVRQHLIDNNISSPGVTTQNIVDYICGARGGVAEGVGARKLFCILLLFAKENPAKYTRRILDFYQEPQGGPLTDRDLPLHVGQRNRQSYTLVRGANGSSPSCFAPGGFWETSQLRTFDEYQWWLLAPVLDSEQHRLLSDNAVLPWEIRGKPIVGNQSEVRKIQINKSHHKFDSVRLHYGPAWNKSTWVDPVGEVYCSQSVQGANNHLLKNPPSTAKQQQSVRLEDPKGPS